MDNLHNNGAAFAVIVAAIIIGARELWKFGCKYIDMRNELKKVKEENSIYRKKLGKE